MKNLSVGSIQPSSTNPRKHFDPAAIKELSDSIKKHGVLQPILVRAMGSGFEIVAGERRFRAAKDAGLKEIPAVVMTLTDIEAVEIQVIENLQRADLHPLEEAEGYEFLMKQHGYAGAEEIAAKIGKSRSYVYGRLKLCALTPTLKKGFLKGSVNASVALLLARIPETLQDKAAKTILEGKYGEGPLPFRQAVEFLKDNFTLTLSGAPFDTKNECLTLPGVSSCAKCPKRTGNEPELFADIKSADVCTDPECFKKKKENAWLEKTAKAKQEGYTILPAVKSKSLFYDDTLNSFHHVLLEDVCRDDKKQRTYQELLKGITVPIVDILIAQDGRGKPRKLLKTSRVEELLREAGHKFLEKKAEDRRTPTPEEVAETERIRQAMGKAYESGVKQILAKVEAGTKSLQVMRCLTEDVFENCDNTDVISDRRGVKTLALQKAISAMDFNQCLSLMFECWLVGECWNWNSMDEKAFKGQCREFGIDGALLIKQETNALEEKRVKKPEKTS